MTFVGHMLTGAAIGALAMPRKWPRAAVGVGLGIFAVLACVPDIPLGGWGHDRYFFSHSAFVNVVGVGAMLAVVGMLGPRRKLIGGWPVAIAGAAAWLSHLVLDSFYNHGKGVMIGWPFGHWRLNLALPWFHTFYPGSRLSGPNIRVMLIELAFYGPLLAGCVLLRRVGKAGQAAVPK
jgi:hypothetical protein